jgi:hypothetical protein
VALQRTRREADDAAAAAAGAGVRLPGRGVLPPSSATPGPSLTAAEHLALLRRRLQRQRQARSQGLCVRLPDLGSALRHRSAGCCVNAWRARAYVRAYVRAC